VELKGADMSNEPIAIFSIDYDRDGSPHLILSKSLLETIQTALREGGAVPTADGEAVRIDLGKLGYLAKCIEVQGNQPPCNYPNALC
jgi:hypothetical protein